MNRKTGVDVESNGFAFSARKVLIVGFDDFHVARALSPGLTTFAQPLADLAETATEMLAWRLRHGEWKTTAQVLSVTLILRGSL